MSKQRKYDVLFAAIAIVIVCLCMALVSGCVEERQVPKVWGKGDLPAEFLEHFGTDNNARLNFVQTQAINKHGEIIREIAKRLLLLEGADPNMIPVEARLDAIESDIAALQFVEPPNVYREPVFDIRSITPEPEPVEGMLRWIDATGNAWAFLTGSFTPGHLEWYDGTEWLKMGSME